MRSNSSIYAYAEELRRRMIDEYRVVQEAEYAAALHHTNGFMVRHGADSWTVFNGPPTAVAAYGTQELLDYLAENPRTTRTEFEREWLNDYLAGGDH